FGQGCGGSSSPVDSGTDAKDGGNDAKAGTTGGTAGTQGTAGTGTAGTSAAGTGVDAAAGTGMGAAAGTGSHGGARTPRTAGAPRVDMRPDGGMSLIYRFNTTTEMWGFSMYGSTPDPNSPQNLAKISTLAWDMTNDADNSATSGSLKGTVPFTKDMERIDFQ